jgi:hypothetical protein
MARDRGSMDVARDGFVSGWLRRRLRCIVVGAVATGITASGPPAGASETSAGPFSYVTAKAQVAPDDVDTIGSICPEDSRLTGGGGSVKPAGAQRYIASLFPDDVFDPDLEADDGYGIEAANRSQDPGGYGATAICLRKDLDQLFYPQDTNTASGPGFIASGTEVACATSLLRVVGGGADISASSSGLEELYLSRPDDADDDSTPDDGWTMYGLREVPATTASYKAFATCMYRDARKARYRTAKRKVEPHKAITVMARCPRRFHLSGGGGQALFMRITASEPRDGPDSGKAPDDAWRVRAFNTTDDRQTVFADAICLR